MDTLVAKAFAFATAAHAGRHHGNRPYVQHLDEVVKHLTFFGYNSPEHEGLICAGWLHDTIEDTPVSYQDLFRIFGFKVAELVFAVTDELGRNRKERRERTFPKIFEFEQSTVLKLADLAANIKACYYSTNLDKRKMYKREWGEDKALFEQALKKHGLEHLLPVLEELDLLIEEWD